MALKHAKTSGKTDGGDATLVQPSDWNGDHVIDSDGATLATRIDNPSAPSAGNIVLFGRVLAGGALPAFIGPSGVASALQPFIGRNRIGIWAPIGNSSGVPGSLGINAVSGTGAVTARNVATTNYFTTAQRNGYVSTGTAGSTAGFRLDKLQFWIGSSAGLGGFRTVIRFGCSDAATVADARTFVGMTGATTAIGNVNPSTLTNIIGVGTDSGESTLSIMHNDGSGTATKISLGANFPDHTLSTDLYELALFCAPNGSEVGYQVTRLNTGDVASGTITTDLPANTQLLAPQGWRNNGTTALAVGVDLINAYFEKDY